MLLTAEAAAKAFGVTPRSIQKWAKAGAPTVAKPRPPGEPGRPGRGYDVSALADWAIAQGLIDAAQRRRALKVAGLEVIADTQAATRTLAAPVVADSSDASAPTDMRSAKLAAQVRRLEEDIKRLELGNAQRAGNMIDRAEMHERLVGFAAALRRAGEAIRREYGDGPYGLLDAALLEIERGLAK